jgi:hypothetical protein
MMVNILSPQTDNNYIALGYYSISAPGKLKIMYDTS